MSKQKPSGYILYKLHRQGKKIVLAAADADVLGICHESGGRILDLKNFRSFYQGKRATPSELEDIFPACTSANLVGEKAVAFALKRGIIKSSQVIKIGNVPHVQIYDLREK